MTKERSPGRPRDESVDRRIIKATLESLNEEGMAGLSIEGIASKAGASKATIYRRWDSKEELVVDAVADLVEAIEIPDTGDLRADLLITVEGLLTFVSDSRAGEVFPWLVGEVAAGTPVGIRYATDVVLPRRQMVADVLKHAVQRGDLRADLDIEVSVDMLIGPIIMRKITGLLRLAPESWFESLVDSLIAGWSSGSA